jgi:hypothetical protein
MTEKSKNRGYNIPKAGQTNWHEPINENWKSIDADIQTALEMAQAALEAATSSDETDSEHSTTDAETTDSNP